MKEFKNKILLHFLVVITFLSSCSSTKSFEGKSDFCGIVNDSQNNPVVGYRVKLTDFNFLSQEAITNSSGVFIFEDIRNGKYTLSGSGKNWARFSDLEINFYDRSELFCIQVKRLSELTDDIYNLLLLSDFNSAQKTLNLISDANSDDLHVLYLHSVTEYLQGDFKKSRKNLEKILAFQKKFPDFSAWSVIEDFYQLVKTMEKKT